MDETILKDFNITTHKGFRYILRLFKQEICMHQRNGSCSAQRKAFNTYTKLRLLYNHLYPNTSLEQVIISYNNVCKNTNYISNIKDWIVLARRFS